LETGIEQGGVSAVAMTTCRRVETCLNIQQRQHVRVAVIHFDSDIPASDLVDGHEITIQPEPATVSRLEANSSLQALWIEASFTRINTYRVSILFQGQHIKQSPYFITVAPAVCLSDNEEPDKDGMCVCLANTISIGGKCVKGYILALPLTGLCILIAGIVFWQLLKKQRAKLDQEWQIDESELEFEQAEPFLGEGAFATVELAHFRNIRVAVKTLKSTPMTSSKSTSSRTSHTMRSTRYSGSIDSTRYDRISPIASQHAHHRVCLRRNFIREMRLMARLRHPCITVGNN
jgi:hypothetical protein